MIDILLSSYRYAILLESYELGLVSFNKYKQKKCILDKNTQHFYSNERKKELYSVLFLIMQ